MQELVTFVAKSLVDHPDQVVVHETEGPEAIILELNVAPEELTERFVRGDASRNTEGSGLGLAIARSFTELQKGTFAVDVDGDLFKVTLVWKKDL